MIITKDDTRNRINEWRPVYGCVGRRKVGQNNVALVHEKLKEGYYRE